MTYAHQVAAALAANDQQMLIALAIELAGHRDAADRQRAAAAERKRRQRHTEPPRASHDIAGPSVTSRDIPGQSVTSRDIAGRHVTPPSPPFPSPSSPTTLLTTSFSPPPPEHSEHAAVVENSDPLVRPGAVVGSVGWSGAAGDDVSGAVALALSAALGERCGDVRAFLRTRASPTWSAWMRQMLKLIGPGSPFTPDDLADACNDALALDAPITGPHALRAFIAKQRQERVAPSRAVRALAVATAEDAAGEQRHRNGLVAGRKAQRDGDEWWARMMTDALAAGRVVWGYAYEHLDEPGRLDGAPQGATQGDRHAIEISARKAI